VGSATTPAEVSATISTVVSPRVPAVVSPNTHVEVLHRLQASNVL